MPEPDEVAAPKPKPEPKPSAFRSRRRGSKDVPDEIPPEVLLAAQLAAEAALQEDKEPAKPEPAKPEPAQPASLFPTAKRRARLSEEQPPRDTRDEKPAPEPASSLRSAAAATEGPPTADGESSALALRPLDPVDRTDSPATEVLSDGSTSKAKQARSEPRRGDEPAQPTPSRAQSGTVAVLEGALQRQPSYGQMSDASSGNRSESRVRAAPQYHSQRTTSKLSFDDEVEEVEDERSEQYESDQEIEVADSHMGGRMSMYDHQENDSFSDVPSDFESDDGVRREPVMAAIKDEDEYYGLVEVNSNGMLCTLCFSVLWVFGAAGMLLALTWHYVWVEVTDQANLAAKAAVDSGCLYTSEVLSPMTTLVKTLDLGFRGGQITAIGDYDGFRRVLEPFFEALPGLREVEMADTPEYLQYVTPGSILAVRHPSGGLEMRSDRGDCTMVPGRRGCTLEGLRANGSDWFEECKPRYPHPWSPLPLLSIWSGPTFARNLWNEAVCDDICWSPTYSMAARLSGGRDPLFVSTHPRAYDPYLSVIVRVTMEASVFTDVLRQVQIQSRGEAFICTDAGVVVAAVDMANSEMADPETGDIKMVKAWQFSSPWASGVDEAMVSAGEGKTKTIGSFLVSAWKLESPHNATSTLGENLRIVVAIPSEAFADSVLTSLRWWFIATSAVPVVFIALATIITLYQRIKGAAEQKRFRHMSIEALAAITEGHQRETRHRNGAGTQSLGTWLSKRKAGGGAGGGVAAAAMGKVKSIGNAATRRMSLRNKDTSANISQTPALGDQIPLKIEDQEDSDEDSDDNSNNNALELYGEETTALQLHPGLYSSEHSGGRAASEHSSPRRSSGGRAASSSPPRSQHSSPRRSQHSSPRRAPSELSGGRSGRAASEHSGGSRSRR